MKLRGVLAVVVGAVGIGALVVPIIAAQPDDERIRIRVVDRTVDHVVSHVTRVVERIVERSGERAVARWTHAVERVPPTQDQSGDPCRNQGWDDDDFRFCEIREHTLPAGPLTVDAGRNGGIQVHAWDRNEVRVRAVVNTHARSDGDAKQLAAGVQIQAGSGRVSATGPSTGRREGWSVTFLLDVPRQTDLDLTANNGGVSISGVQGTIRFETSNGGVRLAELAGDVRGQTRNGGVTVSLSGSRWDGAGLDVQTTNGGVTLAIPDGYNAELSTRTVNGGFRSDFPLTVQGELSPRRGIQTTLGSGGPPVSVRTTNGGVKIGRR